MFSLCSRRHTSQSGNHSPTTGGVLSRMRDHRPCVSGARAPGNRGRSARPWPACRWTISSPGRIDHPEAHHGQCIDVRVRISDPMIPRSLNPMSSTRIRTTFSRDAITHLPAREWSIDRACLQHLTRSRPFTTLATISFARRVCFCLLRAFHFDCGPDQLGLVQHHVAMPQPPSKLCVLSRNRLTKASAPSEAMTEANSSRRVARLLIVP